MRLEEILVCRVEIPEPYLLCCPEFFLFWCTVFLDELSKFSLNNLLYLLACSRPFWDNLLYFLVIFKLSAFLFRLNSLLFALIIAIGSLLGDFFLIKGRHPAQFG